MSELLNPVQQKIASGMSPIIAFLSESTCGEACWEAREDICRCSCGGKNHGCMRTADGVRPTRTSKIDGFRYELKAVGVDVYAEAHSILKSFPERRIGNYSYQWSETDKGSPVRVKSATKQQLAAWPELSSYRDEIERLQNTPQTAPIVWMRQWPYLLWIKVS